MPVINSQKLFKLFERYKYLLLVVAVGTVLLLWPSGREKQSVEPAEDGYQAFPVDEIEKQLEAALAEIDGAGRVRVVLTLKSDMELVYQEDVKSSSEQNAPDADTGRVISDSERKTVLRNDSGSQQPVVRKRFYPEYQGALIVCEGGGNAAVCLDIIDAVSSLTGLRADKVIVSKMKQ